jgi:hypothetical protein
VALVCVAALTAGGCAGRHRTAAPTTTTTRGPSMDDLVHLNQVQFIGTHNSYHRRLRPQLFEKLAAFDAHFAATVDYEHPPLDRQLDEGIRQFELDVYADPDGGRFASRAANALIGEPKESGIAELAQPGFKVLHMPEIDYESSCLAFATCLATIDRWSGAHPHHLPIMVLVEAKDSPSPDVAHLGFATPAPIDTAALDELDAEIRKGIGASRLLTPDQVRGSHATLRAAVTTGGWPTLAASRGKVLFCLISEGDKRALYAAGHPSLAGRAMFSLSAGDAPEAAVTSRPSPTTEGDAITTLVRQGFLVRTRADADTAEARADDVTRRDAALAGAATWISTDYPSPDPALGTPYQVRFPGDRLFRCHPLLAPPACRDDALE